MAATVTLANETLSRSSAGVVFPPSYEAWAGLGERDAEAGYQGPSPWIDFVLPVGREQSTSQATEVIPVDWEAGLIPRTAFGDKLLALRIRAIDAGMKLLSEEEVLEEVRRRRGEPGDSEADLY